MKHQMWLAEWMEMMLLLQKVYYVCTYRVSINKTKYFGLQQFDEEF